MPVSPQESAWTGERVAHLIRLWNSGCSAGLIARELGATTRSAVISKVHRLGLAQRDTHTTVLRTYPPRYPPRAPRQKANAYQRHPAAPSTACPQPAAPRPPRRPRAQPRTFPELTPAMCRYIDGQPNGVNTFYCAACPLAGHSYCPYHYRLTHQPYQQRRRPPGAWS